MLIVDPLTITPVPWRNGAGVTRELAQAADADGQQLWRVSLADLAEDSAFSSFPGTDRLFIALGRLALTIDGVVVSLDTGDQARFAGEAAVSVALEKPTRALNVMTRRGRCRADVVLHATQWAPADSAVVGVTLGDVRADVFVIPTEGTT